MNNISGINSTTTSTNTSEWVTQSLTSLTYVNATQFSASTDLRTTFLTNIRVKATVTAGTIYGSVTAASFAGATTTVTVVWDSGSLDSGLSAIYTGLLAPTNSSAPPSSFVPVGTIWSYAGSTAPTGWLLCYGQAISRTTYAALFSAISTTYGAGDGSTTFNVPDCRGRALIGLDNLGGSAASRVAAATSLGQAAGAETHKHTGPSHTHSYTDVVAHTHSYTASRKTDAALSHDSVTKFSSGGSNEDENFVLTSTSTGGASGTTAAAGTGDTSTTNNMNPYIAISYIIKY
jgi:microcystin-dependent protein